MAENQEAAQEKREGNLVNVTLPRKIAGNDSFHNWTRKKDGLAMVEITLPPHFTILKDGEEIDASFYKFSIPEKYVHMFENDPNYMNVGLMVANANGEEWINTFRRTEGHFENPDAEGKERGQFIVDEEKSIKCTSMQLGESAERYRSERQAYFKEHEGEQKGQAKAIPEKKAAAKKSPEQAEKAARSQAKAMGEDKPAKAKKQSV